MLRWLRAVVDWMFSRGSSLTQLSLQAPNPDRSLRLVRRRFDNPPDPRDFDSRVRELLWRGPSGRSSSAAVSEPDDGRDTVLVAGPRRMP